MTPLARLRGALALFFVALAVPAGLLIREAYLRLQWESFHQQQTLAEDFTARVQERLDGMLRVEEARRFADYSFFDVLAPRGDAPLARSPLAAFPPPAGLPGLVGHFQVDADGRFSAPFEPPAAARAGFTPEELAARDARAQELRSLLAANHLLAAPRAAPAQADALALHGATAAAPTTSVASAPLEFELLKQSAAKVKGAVRGVDELELEDRFQGAPVMAEEKLAKRDAPARAARKEQGALAEVIAPSAPAAAGANDARSVRVRTFESEVDPFELGVLASGQLVLFRKVWRDGQRWVQGLVIERAALLDALVGEAYGRTALSASARLTVTRQGEVLYDSAAAARGAYDAAPSLRGTLLHRARLGAPFGEVELVFSVTRLGLGAGARVVATLAAILALVLVGGTLLMYRLGARQLALARQQQDFIAAVSHELKTPLTSIRMYGEMLREGWAPQEKRQEYYRFIHDEAERLTRLINNVLGLARLSRNELVIEARARPVAELVALIRARVVPVLEAAGRPYTLTCADAIDALGVVVDPDCFTQVLLNLVDNALKFSAAGTALALGVTRTAQGSVAFSVRDHGPGVPREEMEKIFDLFQRGAGALSRATPGTGIGLALARRLAAAMGGRVTLVNRQPGAEFALELPSAQ